MNSTEIIVTIVVSIICLLAGFVYGSFPRKTEEQTQSQTKAGQLLGIAAVGLVLILVMVKQNIASWAAIGALAVGVAIAYIPAVYKWTLRTFPYFKPVSASPLKRNRKRKRK